MNLSYKLVTEGELVDAAGNTIRLPAYVFDHDYSGARSIVPVPEDIQRPDDYLREANELAREAITKLLAKAAA